MLLLHNIGDGPRGAYNTREQILRCDLPMGFDGIYRNVWENRDVLLGKDVTLFVIGGWVGGDNSKDAGRIRPERMADWQQLCELVDRYGCKVGWHTWSHPDLTKLPWEDLVKEMSPAWPMEDIAYPHGRFNADVIQCAKELGYKRGWSVVQGDGSQYQLNRAQI